MATGSIFSGIGGFGSNVISPLDFLGSFGYSLPWIPTIGAAGAPNERRKATPIPKVTIDPDEDPYGHKKQTRARATAEGRRDAQSGRPLLEEVPGSEGEPEHWTRKARRDAQIAEYQKIAADPDYEPDTWYINHWDIHHWSEKIPPGVPLATQAGATQAGATQAGATQAGATQAGTQRTPWTGPATWSGTLPSEALMAKKGAAETPPDTGPGFGQTRTSWDPLGIEGYQATQGGIFGSIPTSYEELGDMLSSFPTTKDEWGDLYSSFPTTPDEFVDILDPMGIAKGIFSTVAGMPATAFFAVAKLAAESRKNARIRSQFPELGEAQTGFFGGTPGFSERDYATLAEYGRASDLGAGWHISVTPEGFQARPAPVRQRDDTPQWGYAPGDRAYDNYMAAHAEMLELGDPLHTLTQAALDQYGLPAGSTQGDLFSVAPPTTGIYDEDLGRTFPGGNLAIDFGAVPGGIDRWGDPTALSKIDQRMYEDAWNEADLHYAWDPTFDPIVFEEYTEDPYGVRTVSTADFNYDYEDPYSKIGLPGYVPGAWQSWEDAYTKNKEVVAKYHAAQEKVSKEVEDILGLPQGPWSSYADFPTAAETAQMKWDATQRALAEADLKLRTGRPELVPDLNPELHAFLQDAPAQEAAGASDPGDFGGDPEGGYGEEDPGVW
jgi:hypothetical protein